MPAAEATKIPEEESAVIEPQETEAAEEVIPEGMVKSYLTGEYVDENIGRRRPVAFMLNNIQAAVPQAGIANAGVVYEAPVEGGITRLMAVMEDYDHLEKIGSMRSCRDYFIFYASGFDAIYTHYGQSAYALPILELPEVNNISGLASYTDSVFYRTADRKSPHNAYTSFEGIQKGIEICGYRQEYAEGYDGSYTFARAGETVVLPGNWNAQIVKPGYQYNQPWFEYNESDGLYYRYQYGDPQIDELTQEQLAYRNILIQISSWRNYDENGYLNIDVDTPGDGIFITAGKAIPVTWKKHTPWGPTYYYDSNGNEITLNTGKTWVCIVQDTYRSDISVTDREGFTPPMGQSPEIQAAAEAADTEY
ncbi:MAG: DUF3048 domain-containing protein [Ruminococcus sp.]|jgi:hypothetical protein